ncbi:hypothetical protein EDB86DRAFT_3092168 [Lactarius hatsudake]|nr:hypothetical protein EDB86DRAFT_3092168 [Lactarius hatsudake]
MTFNYSFTVISGVPHPAFARRRRQRHRLRRLPFAPLFHHSLDPFCSLPPLYLAGHLWQRRYMGLATFYGIDFMLLVSRSNVHHHDGHSVMCNTSSWPSVSRWDLYSSSLHAVVSLISLDVAHLAAADILRLRAL